MSNASTLPVLVALAALRAAGATHVRIEFAGWNDDGCIHTVSAVGADDVIPMPPGTAECIEEWVYEHALPTDDWSNNEGGQGEVVIDLATYEVRVDCTYYHEQGAEVKKRHRALTPIPPAVAEELDRINALGITRFDVYCTPGGRQHRSRTAPPTATVPMDIQGAGGGDLPYDVLGSYGEAFRSRWPALVAWLDAKLVNVRCGDAPANVTVCVSTTTPHKANARWEYVRYEAEQGDRVYTEVR